jgi:DNA-binding SARP family transcriptional activator
MMEFRLLGPLEVRQAGAMVELGGPRQRAVLAALLLRPNTTASVGYLCDAVWNRSPACPGSNLRTYITGLRRQLREADGADSRLFTRPGGYLFVVRSGELDVEIFEQLVAEGSKALREGDPAAAATSLEQALGLWRGHPVESQQLGPVLQAELTRLEESRLQAVEQRCQAMLELGLHKEASIELRRLIADHPLREELWAQLMTALHRAGHRTEALDVFGQARKLLIEELGIEPGQQLQQLQRQVLTADAAPSGLPTASKNAPTSAVTRGHRQLPMDIAEFTGREAELRQILAVAERVPAAADSGPTAVVVTVIEGMAGVGKTQLAIHAAHRLVREHRFDEIQLWTDLRGFDPHQPPKDPGTVLEVFLRSLGVADERIPHGLEARAALYRDRLVGKRALLLLDNAANEEQIRPLLPGSPTCLVLVTSRRNLMGLASAQHLVLDVFSAKETITLLARIAGHDRVNAEFDCANQLAELCGYLPIAIVLAAHRLQTRPTWALHELVARLAAKHEGLNELSSATHALFDLSYRALPAQQQRMFRLVGAHLGVDIDRRAAAALADLPVCDAERLLEELLDAYLLHQARPGRYRMHALIRRYAQDRARHDQSEVEYQAAFARLLDCYLAGAEQATLLLHPTESRHVPAEAARSRRAEIRLTTRAEAVHWIEAEHANLIAAAYRGADLPGIYPVLAVRLIIALYYPLINRGLSRGHIQLNQFAARIACRIGARHEEAQALEDLGTICGHVGRWEESVDYNRKALTMWREIGNRTGEAGCLAGVGIAYHQRQRFGEAITCLQHALAISREIEYRIGEASVLNYLGLVHQGMGKFDQAISWQERSITLYRELGSQHGEAIALANLGWAYQRVGRVVEAIGHQQRALAIFRNFGDRYNEAEQLWGLGQAHHALGHDDQARRYWHRSIVALRELDVLDQEDAVALLRQPVPDTPEIIRLNT